MTCLEREGRSGEEHRRSVALVVVTVFHPRHCITGVDEVGREMFRCKRARTAHTQAAAEGQAERLQSLRRSDSFSFSVT